MYVAKDYSGNIQYSHRIVHQQERSASNKGRLGIRQLMFSADGYVLFVASELGWDLWSVYGHLLASSNLLERSVVSAIPTLNGIPRYEGYMEGIVDCCWAGSGLSLMLLGRNSRSLYSLPLARSAVTTCYNPVLPLLHIYLRDRIPLDSRYYRRKTGSYCTEGHTKESWTLSIPKHRVMQGFQCRQNTYRISLLSGQSRCPLILVISL